MICSTQLLNKNWMEISLMSTKLMWWSTMRVSKEQITSTTWDCSGDRHYLGYVILIPKERKVSEFFDFSIFGSLRIFSRFTKHLRRDGSYSPAMLSLCAQQSQTCPWGEWTTATLESQSALTVCRAVTRTCPWREWTVFSSSSSRSFARCL